MAERRAHGLIVAAGSGTRFGTGIPKQLIELAGRTMLEHCVAAFAESGAVATTIVVTRPDLVAPVNDMLGDRVARVVAGGATRAESVRAGLGALDAPDGDVVLIHDAARPLVPPDLIAAVVAALERTDAVTAAIPASDTLLEVEDGRVVDVPGRSRYHRAQTPQGFRLGIIRRAHAAAATQPEFVATDDCGVVRRFAPDIVIGIVRGATRNLKVTTPADLATAERILSATTS